MAEDYYITLGVSRSASDSEIQKAYRKLAAKYHPDRHADESERVRKTTKQKFQEIQHAYDVLSDDEKRKMYDQFGPDFERMGGGQSNPFGGRGGNPFGGGGGGGRNPFGSMDIDLSQLFGGGGGGGFENMGGSGRRSANRPGPGQNRGQGENIEQEITIPFATAVLGGQYQVSYDRGNGKIESLTVKIPVGIESGKKIRLRGQGRMGPGGNGDLLVKVKASGHPAYSRSGLNLLVTAPITLKEAAMGAKIELPTPHGTITVTVPAGSSSGKSLRLKNMGIKTTDRSGDLIVKLQIEIPDSISAQDQEILEKLSDSWSSEAVRAELIW